MHLTVSTIGICEWTAKSAIRRFKRLLTGIWGMGTVMAVLMFVSCDQIEISNDPSISLAFSTDTVFFDTVFTSRGSATYQMKLYNRSDKSVSIEEISIDNQNSFFRFNVDGLPGPKVEDVTVYARDSIYLFCEVTIDPDLPLEASPFVIEDEIRLVTNGNVQRIALRAWGQNAVYFPSRANRNNIALLTCDLGNITWDDPRPYVIYGVLLVDSCTLNIPPGARVYFNGSLANNDIGIYQEGFLFTLPNGRLEVNGTLDDPVIFEGDRLEGVFADDAGQWPGLRIGSLSRGNEIRHAIIRNSVVGIRADSLSEISLEHVEISNTSSSGILSVHADVQAVNCLFYDNGQNAIQGAFGGNLDFQYCTMASYGNDGEAVSLNNFFCYDPPICSRVNVNPMQANFINCIVVGNEFDEISLIDATEEPDFLNFNFDHCVVRVDDLLDMDRFPDFLNDCISCISLANGDPLFVNANADNYYLDSLSVAIGAARPIPVQVDKEEKPRDPQNPDIGCLEFQD